MASTPSARDPISSQISGVGEGRTGSSSARVGDRLVQVWFAATLFTSAALLFAVQPMIAKMVLPLWGGAPAVWNTCQLFFQAALLAGYAYAHFSVKRLGPKKQSLWHLPLLLVPLAVLPIATSGGATQWGSSAELTARLLVLLVSSVGLPFFVLGATSPLLQRWFSVTGKDPYFLYAASNLGSVLSLLAYPILLEPFVGVRAISRVWSVGYGVLVVLVIGCAILLRRAGDPVVVTEKVGEDAAPPTAMRRVRWVALSFVPSAAMLGVTTYLTTDIAPMPLLWVAPLALYLLSFILVFGKTRLIPHAWMVRILPLGVAGSMILVLAEVAGPLWMVLFTHLATFFVIAMVCHGELANDRPSPKQLTEFFLLMSVGGVVGGIFCALLAPQMFDRIHEYPIALVMAAVARRVGAKTPRTRGDFVLPIAAFAITLVAVLARRFGVLTPTMIFGIPVLAIYHSHVRPQRFAAALGAIGLAGVLFYAGVHGRTLHEERTFFGALRVMQSDDGDTRFVHGVTLHGRQAHDRPREPLGYYTPSGPIGELLTKKPASSVGVVGTLATYARPDQSWTFYEIDPAVVRIAMEPRYFTYLVDAFGPQGPRVQVGDARVKLRDDADARYDILVLDAFSSDAIPTHLLTQQAMDLYVNRLTGHGVIAVHITNRFLELAPVMGNLARATGLVGLGRDDFDVSATELADGKAPSRWVVLARDVADLPTLEDWHPLPERPELGVWTDDFTNIVRIVSL